jgi:1,4-alpha-glucan branching enzyme
MYWSLRKGDETMLKKSYTGDTCRVTFKLPAEVGAKEAAVCGEFNAWDCTSHPMRQLKDGGFSKTIHLEPGRRYRFRYWLDGERWENDWDADDYVPNEFGTEDAVVEV